MANKSKKKRFNYNDEKPITFNDLVEARKQEMLSILPGFYSIVRDPITGREQKVYSPSVWKKYATFRMDGVESE